MNKIYKVIWSKTRNCYVAVSELARNHGKGNVRSEKRGIAKGPSALALCVALSLGVTGSVWAADETVDGNLTVKGNVVVQTSGDDPDDVITLGTDGAITVGPLNTASGDYSFADGGTTVRVVTGEGRYSRIEVVTSETGSVASGINSFAYGYKANAVGDHSFAFGHEVTAGAEDSTEGTSSWNQRPVINGYAAAFGYKTSATGSGSFAEGLETTASGKGSVAAGIKTIASGKGAVAIGNNTQALKDGSFASGTDTTAGGQAMITYNDFHTYLYPNKNYGYYGEYQPGSFIYSSGTNAAAFGNNTTAAGVGAVAFGLGENLSDNYYGSFSAGPADPDHYYRPNSGKTGAYGDYSATFGSGTFTLGPNSVAMGSRTNAIGQNSLAWGYQTFAVGKDSTAFGNNTLAVGNRSTAFGSQTEAAGQDSLAFGIDTKAYAKRSTAFGSHTLTTGEKSTAFGTSTVAQSENSTAFGERSQASGKNSLAFGHYSTTGIRYQSEQDKIDGIYTMKMGGARDYSDSPYIPYDSPYNYDSVKVKVEDKQFAWVLTNEAGNTVKATKDGKDYIVYHAHTNAYQDPNWGYPPADPTYAIKFREYDENGNPGDYYYQEVSYDPETGEVTLLDNIVRVADNDPDQLSLTDLGNEDDDALYEKDKTPRFQYVMDESSSAKNAVAFGNDTNAQADNSLAFGDANIAGGKRSTAFGNHTEATGDSATSFGDNTLASGRNATAFGESSRATKQNATTFGQENAALAKNATAWGHKTKATGEASTAYGDKSLAAGKYATSFGEGSVSFAQDSVSWGSKAVAGISTKDADYQAYMGMINELAGKEDALKAARKAGDIAETARLTSEIAEYEGQIATFYKNRFSVTDQAAADALNQQTADALNQQTVSNLNQQKASEINMANLTEYCSEVEIPSYIAYQNNQIARQLGKSVDELTDDERFTIDKYADLVNEYIAESLGKSVEDLTDDEKATAENLASKMAETMPPDYQKQVLGDNFMTEDNLPEDQKMTVDKLPDDQKMTAENLPDDQKAVAKNMGKNSTAWGQNTNAFGRAATAWGNKTVAAGANSTAWGNQSIAVGGDSTALGKSSKAWGDNSLAALGGTTGKGSETEDGYTVKTNAKGAVAVGVEALAEKSYTYAIGNKAKATADNTMAFGNGAGASGIAAIAIGTNAVASGEQSISVGYGNEVTGAHSGAFGDPNKMYGSNSYAVGNNNTIGTEGSTDVGNNSFVVGNGVSTTSNYVVALGDSTSVTKDYSVALGATSVAQRDKENGGVGAGYDVTTGTNYAGEGADSPTWVSTLAAVSVGGTADDTDAEIGTAATATRQITGVAAGTADTDAVNVAQLRLAGVSVEGGNNITVASATNEETGGTVYTVNGLKTVVTSEDGSVTVTGGTPDENGVITFDLSVVGGGTGGGTTYTGEQTTESGEGPGEGSTTFTLTGSDGSESSINIKAGDNVTITKDGDAAVIKAENTTYTGKQTTESGEGPGEGSTTFTLTGSDGSESSINIKAGDNVTITKDGDAAVIKAENTTYTGKQTTESGEGPGEGSTTFTLTGSDGSESSINIKAGDNVTITKDGDAAVIKAENTTYEIKKKAGRKGTNVVNDYTLVGSDGKEYPFQDTDTTYTFETDRKKEGTVAATFTVKNEKTGKKVGEFQDTHNGLKNDTNEVKYDDNGEGSVTITDQDGNTTTITGIRSGGDMETINRLGDQISRMDSKIEKVGAGAAALAGLHPLDFDPDEKWDFAASVGSYKSEQAVAIGAFYRPNEDTMFSIGGTIGNGNNMVNVGVSWKFGQKNRISANRISSAKEIIELRKNQEDVHSFLADAVAGNQLDLSKIQLFPDVEENHWAYDYVATMAGNGVLEGYPDGYFKGNRNMTRYEMAAVLYRLMQNGARLSDRALTEFAPELDRIRVDTITHHKDGTPHIQRVRTIKERVDEKSDLSPEKAEKKKAKIKVAEKPVE